MHIRTCRGGVMRAVAKVIAAGIANPKRMGITGLDNCPDQYRQVGEYFGKKSPGDLDGSIRFFECNIAVYANIEAVSYWDLDSRLNVEVAARHLRTQF